MNITPNEVSKSSSVEEETVKASDFKGPETITIDDGGEVMASCSTQNDKWTSFDQKCKLAFISLNFFAIIFYFYDYLPFQCCLKKGISFHSVLSITWGRWKPLTSMRSYG